MRFLAPARPLLKSRRRMADNNKILGSVPTGCPPVLALSRLVPAVAVVAQHITSPGLLPCGLARPRVGPGLREVC
jgi:hypothetical protein